MPLHLRVTSATVMNVFFVPRLGSEIYSMSGMATQINLQADQPGTYPGLSANFSGDGFSDMHFTLESVDSEQFNTWVASARKPPARYWMTPRTESLLRQTSNIQPYTYREVDCGTVQPDRIAAAPLRRGAAGNAIAAPAGKH